MTKRILNVRLLIATGAILAVVVGLGFLWHRHESSKLSAVFLQRADTLADDEKWADAAEYYGRCLRLEPGDSEVRLRLIETVEKSAVNRAGKLRLVSLLYQSLGTLPERDDLRLNLVEQLIALGDYQGARTQASKLIASSQGDTQTEARRYVAIALSAQAKPGGLVSVVEAAKALEEALAKNPGDVEVAAITAEFYRRYPERIGTSATAANADAIMDRMIQSDPQNPAAYIARYRYRLQYDREHALADLAEAVKRAPDHVEALLLQGEAILAAGNKSGFLQAKRNAAKIIELKPSLPEGYLLAAKLHAAEENRQEAADVLSAGHAKLGGTSLELDYLLASVLLDLKRFDEARQIAKEYSAQIVRALPQLDTPQRLQLENRTRLLKARLALVDGDKVAAARELNAIVAATDLADNSRERLYAESMLATLWAEDGRMDLAADRWANLAKRSPGLNQAGWRAGIALLESGRLERAIEHLEIYLQLPEADPRAWETLVKAELRTQGQRPAAERDWTKFLAAIDNARQQLPKAWEWQFAEAAYLASQGGTAGRTKALSRLREIEAQFADHADVRAQLIISYQQMGDSESVDRGLKEYQKLQPNKSRQLALTAAVLASRNQVDDALELLSGATVTSTPAEVRDLSLTKLKLLTATRRLDEAQELAAKLIGESPKDSRLLAGGLEIALKRRDLVTAKRWEELLRQADSVDQFEWRFYRAWRMLTEFNELDSAGKAELGELVKSLHSERPTWVPVIAIHAQYSALSGNRREAIEGFQAALAAGDRRPETLEQLVRLLYAEGRFEEATRYLSEIQAGDEQKARFDSLAIVAAVEGNRLSEARQLAKQAVDRKSQDPLHYIWLANLSLASGDQADAEQTYRTALQLFPRDVRLWNAVFLHFVQTRQEDRARQTLKRWTDQVPMTEAQKQLVMGQGHECLGDLAVATEYYRKAIEQEPQNAAGHFLLAKSLMSTDVAAAREELLKVLEIDSTQAEARRLMAVMLAASGGDADWAKAVEYLEAGAGDGGSPVLSDADERLKAILLTRKGRNRQERKDNFATARRLFTNRLELRPDGFSELDRLLLAGIYEQEALLNEDLGSLQAARDTLRPTVDRADVTISALANYIKFLLRQVSATNAEGNSEAARDLRAVFAEDAQLRLDELDQLIAQQPKAEQRFAALALRSRLLFADGRSQEALKLLDETASAEMAKTKTDAERAKILLQVGNLIAESEASAVAESWYRRLMEIAPQTYVLVAQSLVRQGKTSDAVELCLEQIKGSPSPDAAAVIASILSSGKVGAEVTRKATQVIDTALDANRGHVKLLMTVAMLRLQQENDDEAIRMFRRVVELEPKNTLALNNLATLLAERPDERDEALEYIERAISIVGRQPALLDTQGTILYHAGRHQEAVAALEEAVAGSASDPRYYFHLAMAYDGAGQQLDAQQALATALRKGLDDAMLTKGDQELLASLKRTLLTADIRGSR